MKRNIFNSVAGNKPRLNRFDCSYTNTFSARFGILYPVQCDEVIPGDVWKMSVYCHTELMPLVAPVMSDIQLYAHTFFVPYRVLYGVDTEDGKDIWEKFITGGEEGDYDVPLPAWSPDWESQGFSSLKIWDYVGNPVSYDPQTNKWTPIVPKGLDVSIAPKYAYNMIFNEYYRDERLVDEVDKDNEDLLVVSFKKDYFTSALDSQQLGVAPSFPISYTYDEPRLVPSNNSVGMQMASYLGAEEGYGQYYDIPGFKPLVAYGESPIKVKQVGNYPQVPHELLPSFPHVGYTVVGKNPQQSNTDGYKYLHPLESNKSVDGSENGMTGMSSYPAGSFPVGVITDTYTLSPLNLKVNSGFDVSDMRLAFAIQRLQELSMRSGTRYTEWLSAHYNTHPRDDRLQRPEYIGGCVMNVTVSPLTQNSGTEGNSGTQLTPQGNKVGIGQIDSVQKIGNYRVLEHGLIMTCVSFRPKPIYKQGVNRQWLRQVKEDYYIPELAYLSEQGVYNSELYVGADDDDSKIFGYQARWNELRSKLNIVTGAVREQFNYWTLARTFSSRPALNEDFINIDYRDFNHIFAVQDEDNFVVSWSALNDVYRPIPAFGVPGLIDHVYGGM